MDGETPLSVGIVEDEVAVMRFFVSVIGRDPGLAVAFQAGSLAEARDAVARKGAPSLCLVDLGLPDGSGVDLLRELKAGGDTRVLVTTVLGDRETVMTALRAGADGYILKTASVADMLVHIRQTLEGFTPISPQVATYLLEILRPGPPAEGQVDSQVADQVRPALTDDGEALTAREAEVLSIFSRGLTYDETARVLGISANTVRDFVRKIYNKLKVHSRSEALFEAMSLGLIHPGHDRG